MNKHILKTSHSFDSAHFLEGHNAKCQFCHGHRWLCEVKVTGEKLIENGSSRGMLVDFTDLKNDFKNLIDFFDHCLIIESPSGEFKEQMVTLQIGHITQIKQTRVIEVPFRPTAELFSKYFYNRMTDMGYNVISFEVFETPTNSGYYGV